MSQKPWIQFTGRTVDSWQSLLSTAYVVRREGNIFTRVCPSIHPSVCSHLGGGTLARSRSSWGGGRDTPVRSTLGGVPLVGGTPPQVPPGQGVPHRRYPSLDLAGWGDTNCWGGTPPWVPPIGPGWGVPPAGGRYPTSGIPLPPSDLVRGVPLPGGAPLRETDGVLDTPRSVCLLRSPRRSFLLHIFLIAKVFSMYGT